MRFLITLVIVTCLLGTPCLAEELPDLDNEKTRINYSVGYQVGSDFKHQGIDINPELLLKGIQDVILGNEPLMKEQEMRTTLMELQQKISAPQKEKSKS